jgi:hypothetical protein
MSVLSRSEAAAPAFSPSDAAISGFRFIARRPGVIAIWTGVFLLYELLVTLLLISLPGNTVGTMRTFSELNRTNPEAALAMLPAVGFVMLVYSVGFLALYAVMYTAAYRAFLTPSDKRPGYLHLGVDEFYMACVIVLAVALSSGYLFLVIFIGGLLWAIGSGLADLLKFLYDIALGFGLLGALLYPFVRFSLAMPMTFMDKHVRLIESWKATRGEFWSMLGAYVLAALLIFMIYVVMWSIVGVVALAAILGTGGSFTSLQALFQADTSSIAAYLTPTTLIAALLNAIASALFLAVVTGPVAEAYRAMVGGVAEPSPAAPRALEPKPRP